MALLSIVHSIQRSERTIISQEALETGAHARAHTQSRLHYHKSTKQRFQIRVNITPEIRKCQVLCLFGTGVLQHGHELKSL